MPRQFVPLRLGPPILPHLDARLRHIEAALVEYGHSPVNQSQQVQAQAALGKSAAVVTVGGGSGSNILGGDVTGAPVNNTVSNLQATPLNLSGVSTGDLLFAAAGPPLHWINGQNLNGNYSFTGLTNSLVLTLHPAGATSSGGLLACDDFSNNVLLFVQPRADLDAGFHPVTVDIAGNQAGKSALRVQTANSATAGPVIANTLDGSGNTAAQWALQTTGAAQFSLATSVAANLRKTGDVLPIWQSNTDGSQKGGLSLRGYDNVPTAREFLQGGNNGTAATIGFLGTVPVVRQAGASAAGIAAITDANAKAAVSALQSALAALGLITSPA